MTRHNLFSFLAIAAILLIGFAFTGCETSSGTTDEQQTAQQEQIVREGAAQVGLPNIKNFRELRLIKDIQELCDQTGLVTYAYVENVIPTVSKGHTALGGKFTFLGECSGYPLPYATQMTNPQKVADSYQSGYAILPQSEPNGLFKPESAAATWLMIKGPDGEVRPVYMEPNVSVYQWRLPLD